MNIVASLITLALVTTPALATDTAVSISIGQPGFYGRIDIGDAPRPVLIYDEPIVVVRSYRVVAPPIYMRVPPGHAKNWKKHCAGYDACGRRVYFVQDAWYRDVYAPHYRKHHAHKGGKGRGKS
jgi:hypothetical protein